jgi:hypothetical protein
MAKLLQGVLLGTLGAALALELLFRLLPVSTATQMGYALDPLILNYPPQHRWVASTGWDLRRPKTLQANNVGFVAEHDFGVNPQALALIGDSFVDASMLDANERPAAQLERILGDGQLVYAMGSPGSALLDYAERLRYAYQRFGVRNFVILMEDSDVRQSFCGSGNNHGPCLDGKTFAARIETLPPPSAAKRLLRHSALAQYVVGQLKVDFAQLAANAFKRELPKLAGEEGGATPAAPARSTAEVGAARVLSAVGQARVTAVTDIFWQRIAAFAPQAHIVFVVDGGRSATSTAAGGALSDLELERRLFIAIARARGYTVVDGEQVFAEHMATSPLSLSVSPQDGHMNGYAVGLLMRATAQALR